MADKNHRIVTLEMVPTREEMLDGRRYLVAPITMMVEGVRNGYLYSGPELADTPETWNGIPVTVSHPSERGMPVSANTPERLERQTLGRIFNAFFDKTKRALRAEVWIDMEKAGQIAPDVLPTIRSGQRLEVSIGLYTDDDGTPGMWGGVEYSARVTNFRPDHLALLPEEEGACSWADGCGVRANLTLRAASGGAGAQTNEPAIKERGMMEKLKGLARSLAACVGFKVEDTSHEELRGLLQRKLDALDKPGWMHFVREVFDGYMVYEAVGSNPSETGETMSVSKLYKIDFMFDKEKVEAELTGEPIEVREQREFVPIGDGGANAEGGLGSFFGNEDGQGAAKKEKEERTMANKELVDKLIACDCTKFTAESRSWLETLTEAQLQSMEPVPPKSPEPPPVTEPEPLKAPETIEELLANAPEDMRMRITDALKMADEAKTELVGAILASAKDVWTEADLKGKPVSELKRLAATANVKVNFSGRAPGVNDPPEDKRKAPDMIPVFDLKR